MDIQFQGQRALVTGAGKGIGRATCLRLVQLGAFVVGVSRTESDLVSLQEACQDIRGDSFQYFVGDLSDSDVAQRIAEDVGDIDLLVNNSGVAYCAPFLDFPIEQWDNIMNVNLRAHFVITQVIARNMVKREKGGSIVNVSSVISDRVLDEHVAYCTSKGGLDQFTRSIAFELGRYGIRVNSVNPTVVMTPMGKKVWGDAEKAKPLLDRVPMGRFVEEEEVVDAIAYLLSDKASILNGVILKIDGGLSTS
eukprot:TRINITY_DN4739_c0_g1_i1.p1 TRINITY_DN4739_c0_g1~~TRINITY_DN4739_c0_g1_i1.p1  ORF type:complete len:250 (+),score=54.89 TRINITY_DN4739_c0_g1_i1:52-801(+)